MTAQPPNLKDPQGPGTNIVERIGEKRKPRANEENWQDKLMRSRYALIALALHAVLFLMFGTYVIFEAVLAEEEEGITFVQGDALELGSEPPPPDVAPPPDQDSDANPEDIQVPTQQVAMPTESVMDVIGTDSALASAPPIPVPPMPVPSVKTPLTTKINNANSGPSLTSASFDKRAAGIRGTLKKWGRGKGDIGRQTGKNVTAEFKAYLARYQDGDWASTISMKNGKISNGSILNLMIYTTEWTKNRVKATLVPEPIELGSPELLEVMPPFVLMTGRKDFTLTEQEIKNLQAYLVAGGCIWGDSGLAGKGSRFDVAFKREMKRVLPDADKLWEEIPNDHPIYTEGQFPFEGPPPGMNYYDEPLQVIKMDNQLAVLYTPNDYADMFRMVYKKGVTPLTLQGHSKKAVRYTPNQLRHNRGTFFRNFNEPATEKTYKFGINIIIHLLLRFDKQLLMAPGG